jgi:hypothetical protein
MQNASHLRKRFILRGSTGLSYWGLSSIDTSMESKRMSSPYLLGCLGILALSTSTLWAQNTQRPLFELFTSSTCGPCASMDPVLDTLLEKNKGKYAIVKYQVNFPGSGDPYYIADNGSRVSYYNVSAAPTLKVNGQTTTIASFGQKQLDSTIALGSTFQIQATATLQGNQLSVSGTLQSAVAQNSGLKLHIALVEALTTNNAATNGQTFFHNVNMKMLPSAAGTTLGALNPAQSQNFAQSLDITGTKVETRQDLSVVVWIQEDAKKSVLQSLEIPVQSDVQGYETELLVLDAQKNPMSQVAVEMQKVGLYHTDASGKVHFSRLLPGTYTYSIKKSGFDPQLKTIQLGKSLQKDTVILTKPRFFFYEDFEAGFGNQGWIARSAQSKDFLYVASGEAMYFQQSSGSTTGTLISPKIALETADSLYLDAGKKSGSMSLEIGYASDTTLSDYQKLDAISPPAQSLQKYAYALPKLKAGHLVFKYLSTAQMSYLSIDNIALTGQNISPILKTSAGVQVHQMGTHWEVQIPEAIEIYLLDPQGSLLNLSQGSMLRIPNAPGALRILKYKTPEGFREIRLILQD